jgi:hypothetical protein
MSESRPHEQDEVAELDRLRTEVRDLRARLRAHPLISEAQGILRERYALPDTETAFALLQRASQQYNVNLPGLKAGASVLCVSGDGSECSASTLAGGGVV